MYNYNMNICITGVGGYLGRATALALVQKGHSVIGLGLKAERPDSLCEEVKYFSVDIREEEKIASIFEAESIEAVYHFAAIKYVGKCEENPQLCFDINTHGTEVVLNAMKKAGVYNLIFSSSYAVYDLSQDSLHLTEGSFLKPVSVYGESKKKSEDLVVSLGLTDKDFSYKILRYGNIIGSTAEAPMQTVQSFIDKLLYSLRHDESITVRGNSYKTVDGTIERDFIDIRDVVAANTASLYGTSGIYNISRGEVSTLKQVIRIMENLTNKVLEVAYLPAEKVEPSSIVIANKKATNELNWKPLYSTEETIRNLVETAQY